MLRLLRAINTTTEPEHAMKKNKLYIGLDVHKNSIVVATASEGRAKPVHYGKWGGSNLCAERGLARLCRKLGVAKSDIRIAYSRA